MKDQIKIRPERLHQRLANLAKKGSLPERGVRRLTLTQEDKAGRDLVRSWFEEAGLTVKVDAIGNIFGLTPGRESEPHVLTGSHVDTVATGGPYDGAYGVVGGLEAVQSILESGLETKHPIGVAVFTNEEGVRFFPDMMGSLVFTGALELEQALKSKDKDGVSVGEALDQIGYRGETNPGDIPVKCFMELHVEQGPVLDAESFPLAAVQGVQGLYWTEYTFRGATNHAGTTPMNMRRDALLGAAETIVFARGLCGQVGGDHRATIGSLTTAPCLSNVVAEKAVFIVDSRNADLDRLKRAQTLLDEEVQKICTKHGLEYSARELVRVDPVAFDQAMIEMVEDAAQEMRLSSKRMISGAGHDAQMMASIAPTAMVFVPSKDGVSHSVYEHTDPDDLTAGARVLTNVLARLAGI